MIRTLFFLSALLLLGLSEARAEQPQVFAPKVVAVADGVYAVVGPTAQRDAVNLGNNATFGVVVTAAGLVLIDPGGSYKGAAALHRVVKGIADLPVVAVINTGGQDHRWLGNGYWKAQGAKVYASAAAVADQAERQKDQLVMLANLIGVDGLAGTEAVQADATFDKALDMDIGGVRFEVRHVAQAHTPGDAHVWLPQMGVVFAGDIVYHDRMLGIMEHSNSKTWLDAFAAVEALGPTVVVPGHGAPAPLDKARAQTRDYLVFLRAQVRAAIDKGGDAMMAGDIDQSRFMSLEVADQIAGRNAQAVFMEMEWE